MKISRTPVKGGARSPDLAVVSVAVVALSSAVGGAGARRLLALLAIDAIEPVATAEEAQARFSAEPSLDALIVLDDDGWPRGLLTGGQRRLTTQRSPADASAGYPSRSIVSVAPAPLRSTATPSSP